MAQISSIRWASPVADRCSVPAPATDRDPLNGAGFVVSEGSPEGASSTGGANESANIHLGRCLWRANVVARAGSVVVSVDVGATASSASLPAADGDVIDGADEDGVGGGEGGVGGEARAAQRSEPRERRDWLRFLDPVLAEEIRLAGALSCEELIALADRPLKGRASSETIREWWEYASRRGWLQRHEADRCQLMDTARAALQARHEYMWQPNPFEGAKAIAKWGLTGTFGVASYAVGHTTGTTSFGLGAILAVLLVLVLGLVLAGTIMRWIDRPTDRYAARRACDWLDGRRVPLTWRSRSEVDGIVVRLYGLPSLDWAGESGS